DGAKEASVFTGAARDGDGEIVDLISGRLRSVTQALTLFSDDAQLVLNFFFLSAACDGRKAGWNQVISTISRLDPDYLAHVTEVGNVFQKDDFHVGGSVFRGVVGA